MSAEFAPIVREILEVESRTTAEIRVHLSRSRWERDPVKSARSIFRRYGMARTSQRNAVLFYFNLTRKGFAIIPDDGLSAAVDPRYWDELARILRDDLLSTRYENAVALAIRTVGVTLAEKFPREAGPEQGLPPQ